MVDFRLCTAGNDDGTQKAEAKSRAASSFARIEGKVIELEQPKKGHHCCLFNVSRMNQDLVIYCARSILLTLSPHDPGGDINHVGEKVSGTVG